MGDGSASFAGGWGDTPPNSLEWSGMGENSWFFGLDFVWSSVFRAVREPRKRGTPNFGSRRFLCFDSFCARLWLRRLLLSRIKQFWRGFVQEGSQNNSGARSIAPHGTHLNLAEHRSPRKACKACGASLRVNAPNLAEQCSPRKACKACGASLGAERTSIPRSNAPRSVDSAHSQLGDKTLFISRAWKYQALFSVRQRGETHGRVRKQRQQFIIGERLRRRCGHGLRRSF
jgi:hypothetical protein